PNKTQEELIAFIWPTQASKAPASPLSYPDQLGPPRQVNNSTPPSIKYIVPCGPRRAEYPPLPENLVDVFRILLKYKWVTPLEPQTDWSPRLDQTKYYHYHRGPGHNIDSCHSFRDLVHDWNDRGRIDWK